MVEIGSGVNIGGRGKMWGRQQLPQKAVTPPPHKALLTPAVNLRERRKTLNAQLM